jgi:hypothetical protein
VYSLAGYNGNLYGGTDDGGVYRYANEEYPIYPLIQTEQSTETRTVIESPSSVDSQSATTDIEIQTTEAVSESTTETGASATENQIVEPILEPTNLESKIVQTEQNMATESRMIASLPSSIEENSWENMLANNPELMSNPDVATAFEGGAEMGEPILVHRLDGENDYYLVPFNKPSKTDSEKLLTFVVVMLNADGGKFIQASSNDEPIEYLTIGRQDAINLVFKSDENIANSSSINAELVWKPELSTSPFYPVWKITIEEKVWIVSQDGTVKKG